MKAARSRLWKVGAITVWCALALIPIKLLVQPKMCSVWPGWVNDWLDGQPGWPIGKTHRNTAVNHAKFTLGNLTAALRDFRRDFGRFPTTEEELAILLVPSPDTASVPNLPYIGFYPALDPWGRPFLYRCPHPATPDDLNSCDLYSLGPDGVVSRDDIEYR